MIRSRNYLNLAEEIDSIEPDLLKDPLSVESLSNNDNNEDNLQDDEQSGDQDDASQYERRDEFLPRNPHKMFGQNDNIPELSSQNDHDENDIPISKKDKTLEMEQQNELLRDLLLVERRHNGLRAENNKQLSNYIFKLESEYLDLQRNLIATLEMAKRSKSQLDSQIEQLEITIKEKDRLIDGLKCHLESLDESKLKSQFESRVDQQRQLAKVELAQVESKCESLEKQLKLESAKNSQLVEEFKLKLEDREKSHEEIRAKVEEKFINLKREMEQILLEPKNELIRSLREEKLSLESRLEEDKILLNESRAKQESLGKRVQAMLREMETNRINWEEESGNLQAEILEQRRLCKQLKLELVDKEDQLELNQFSLERAQSRVSSLLDALKSKEAAYGQLVENLGARHEQEKEKLNISLRLLERQVCEQTSELEKRSNELARFEMKHDNELEQIRNDRDDRLSKLDVELAALKVELDSCKSNLVARKSAIELKDRSIEQLQSDANQAQQEAERLSLVVSKLEARLTTKDQLLEEQCQKLEVSQQEARRFHDEQNRNCLLSSGQRCHEENLIKSLQLLRTENESLVTKLQISENSLSQARNLITREKELLNQEYESKLDKSRVRYRKYGFKLKRYFDHLRLVHSHICDLDNCQSNSVKH